MGPKVSAAIRMIANMGEPLRASIMKDGIGVEKSLEITIDDLKRRRPRLRHKKDKEVLELELRAMSEALEEFRASLPVKEAS